jgi:hypothetical protein
MSFELYLDCVDGNAACGIPRIALAKLFGGALSQVEPGLWQVNYDALNSCELYLHLCERGSDTITGMMVSRPCGDLRLWDALFETLRLAPMCLYFPGCISPLVAQATLLDYPSPIFEALGPPHLVASGQEIQRAIVEN